MRRADFASPATPRLTKDGIMTQPLIDPITHAWRHCNPYTPLPAALVRYAAPSALAHSLSSAQVESRDVPKPVPPPQDIRSGLLTVAISPRVWDDETNENAAP